MSEQHSRRTGKHNTDVRRDNRFRLTRGGAVAEWCRKGVKCWWVCVCWCWWLCWWNWKASGGTLVWFWDVLPDELDAELGTDGPPGVLRPAAAELFSGPGTLRLPSRSGEMEMQASSQYVKVKPGMQLYFFAFNSSKKRVRNRKL